MPLKSFAHVCGTLENHPTTSFFPAFTHLNARTYYRNFYKRFPKSRIQFLIHHQWFALAGPHIEPLLQAEERIHKEESLWSLVPVPDESTLGTILQATTPVPDCNIDVSFESAPAFVQWPTLFQPRREKYAFADASLNDKTTHPKTYTHISNAELQHLVFETRHLWGRKFVRECTVQGVQGTESDTDTQTTNTTANTNAKAPKQPKQEFETSLENALERLHVFASFPDAKRAPHQRIAFLFLLTDSFAQEQIWARYLEPFAESILVVTHRSRSFVFATPFFQTHAIEAPHVETQWGTLSIVFAELSLLRAAVSASSSFSASVAAPASVPSATVFASSFSASFVPIPSSFPPPALAPMPVQVSTHVSTQQTTHVVQTPAISVPVPVSVPASVHALPLYSSPMVGPASGTFGHTFGNVSNPISGHTSGQITGHKMTGLISRHVDPVSETEIESETEIGTSMHTHDKNQTEHAKHETTLATTHATTTHANDWDLSGPVFTCSTEIALNYDPLRLGDSNKDVDTLHWNRLVRTFETLVDVHAPRSLRRIRHRVLVNFASDANNANDTHNANTNSFNLKRSNKHAHTLKTSQNRQTQEQQTQQVQQIKTQPSSFASLASTWASFLHLQPRKSLKKHAVTTTNTTKTETETNTNTNTKTNTANHTSKHAYGFSSRFSRSSRSSSPVARREHAKYAKNATPTQQRHNELQLQSQSEFPAWFKTLKALFPVLAPHLRLVCANDFCNVATAWSDNDVWISWDDSFDCVVPFIDLALARVDRSSASVSSLSSLSSLSSFPLSSLPLLLSFFVDCDDCDDCDDEKQKQKDTKEMETRVVKIRARERVCGNDVGPHLCVSIPAVRHGDEARFCQCACFVAARTNSSAETEFGETQTEMTSRAAAAAHEWSLVTRWLETPQSALLREPEPSTPYVALTPAPARKSTQTFHT